MKKLLTILACVCFMATAAFAQTGTPAGATNAKPVAAKMYHCPKCNTTADKAGTCAACKVKLVKEGDYYCPGCYAQSTKAGKCTKCNMDMKQMTASTNMTK